MSLGCLFVCKLIVKSCQNSVIINFFAILITDSYEGNFGLIDLIQGLPIMKISMVSYSDILRLIFIRGILLNERIRRVGR